MSWLRDHFYGFVYPAMLAATKLSTEIGPPYDPRISPLAPLSLPTELRKLWSLCRELGVAWSYDIREASERGGASRFRRSAKLHGTILRNTVSSAEVARRAEKCPRLFFGGRDVWTLAVIAEKRQIPYLFVPELSRFVADSSAVRPFLESKGFTGEELFVDTGFVGSIPRSLSFHFGRPFKFRLMSQTPTQFGKPGLETKPNQLFPNRTIARAEALETEYLAKYWKTGTIKEPPFDGNLKMKPGTVVQYLASRENIQRAALITSMLWRGIEAFDPKAGSPEVRTSERSSLWW